MVVESSGSRDQIHRAEPTVPEDQNGSMVVAVAKPRVEIIVLISVDQQTGYFSCRACRLALGQVSIVRTRLGVYNYIQIYTLEVHMRRRSLTRTNLLLEVGKIRRLRKVLRSRSNSEAVRRIIDERLAVETGLEALRTLRKLRGPEDVFKRAPTKNR